MGDQKLIVTQRVLRVDVAQELVEHLSGELPLPGSGVS